MPEGTSRKAKFFEGLAKIQFRLYTLLVGTAGAGLLVGSEIYLTAGSLAQHFVRDLGIAAVISSIVTLLIETYAHKRREIDIQTGALAAVFGSVSTPEVWEEIKNRIFGSGVICDEWQLRIKIRTDQLTVAPTSSAGPGIVRDVYIASGTLTYTLRNQLDRPKRVDLEHELEATVKGTTARGGVPRFVRLICQARSADEKYKRRHYDESKLRALQDGDRMLKVPIKLPRSPSAGVKVILTREEVIDVPGQVPWYMNWITLSPKIVIDSSDVPGFDFRVYLRHPKKEALRKSGDDWEFSGVMLPGQGFAIISTPR